MTPVVLDVERLVAGGDGLAREASGRVVFVRGAAPGDRVRARLVDERRDFAKAEIVEVVEAGPGRVDPSCPHVARGCGGCGWQHVDPIAARRSKADLVAEAFRRIGRLDVAVGVGPDLPVRGHRTTIRLLAGDDGRLGYRRSRSHDPVAVDSCEVAHPLIEDLIATLRLDGSGEVTLRCSPSTGGRLALVHDDVDLSGAPADLPVIHDRGAGDVGLSHVVGGTSFHVSAGSFFQTNHDGVEALVDLVGEALEAAPSGRFVDLYGGVGLFAGTVAGDRDVVVVESNEHAASDARRNLAPDARVVSLDVAAWNATPAAVVVADPPRSGLGRPGVAAVAATGAGVVVLVSCDAAAAARDVSTLVSEGYRVQRSTLVDQFPLTPHVEVVTHLARAQEP